MRDLNLRRMINVLSAGSILLTTAGCGEESDEDVIRDICESLEECYEDEFGDQYGSVDDCVEEYESDKERFVYTYGEECGEARVDFLKCINDASDSTCEYDDDACEVEEDSYDEACSIYDYDYG